MDAGTITTRYPNCAAPSAGSPRPGGLGPGRGVAAIRASARIPTAKRAISKTICRARDAGLVAPSSPTVDGRGDHARLSMPKSSEFSFASVSAFWPLAMTAKMADDGLTLRAADDDITTRSTSSAPPIISVLRGRRPCRRSCPPSLSGASWVRQHSRSMGQKLRTRSLHAERDACPARSQRLERGPARRPR